MKKLYLLLIAILFIPSIVLANSISNINMDIYVDSSGTAHVTEEWDVYFNEGTEGYKPYYNLGESKISNFKVMMNGTSFTYDDHWNTSGSFEDKKYRNGINYINNGLELCFGISNYGSNRYTLSYDISNFVVNTSDGYQMIYWTLFPYDFNPSPGRVYIKIHSDFNYSDSLDVWGYGKYGAPTYVYNGYIEMDSESTVSSSEYMTILVKFPSNSFNTSVTLDKTFNEYLNMANDGARQYSSSSNKSTDIIIIKALLLIAAFGVFVILLNKLFISYRTKKEKNKARFMSNEINPKDVPYFREIPFKDMDLSTIYWISSQYNLTKSTDNFLETILLKWLMDGNISIKDNVNSSKSKKVIIFNNSNNINPNETKLFDMLYSASKDGVLEEKELTSWCKYNYSQILNWFEHTIDNERVKMAQRGYIFNESYESYVIGPNLNEYGEKLIGLKKFLNDFSQIKNRSSIEVSIWKEYLIYASIFGIAEKVAHEFMKIYPNIINNDLCNNIKFIETSSSRSIRMAISEKQKIESRAESYSSGGGGFSSGGGGSGSFGGGGGGGGVR